MNMIKEEDVLNSSSNSSDDNKESQPQPQIKRRTHKTQTLKEDKDKIELIFNKVGTVKKIVKKGMSISTVHRMNSITLSHMTSSKMVGKIKKSSKSIVTNIEMSNIIDPSYNFLMNYQLKETALKLFQEGFEENQTKIKFFCNYLFQLAPFNKMFNKLAQSKEATDINKLETILYNLAVKLEYDYIEKQKIVYRHGDDPDKYYIILKGEVDLIIPNELEVMMSDYEYYYYILRLYKYQEHSLLETVLNKNYDLYPLNKKLLEDWIQTAFNTLLNLEKENELNKIKRKRKNNKNLVPNYTNTEELVTHLEKQKKLNLLMLSQNVILLLEKIRIRNERAREAKRNKTSFKKKKDNKKNKNKNTEENLKPNVQYVKLNGQLKKVFTKEDQIEVVEKCANEIFQLIEICNSDFNFQKYVNQLNRTETDKYIKRVTPCFFDEDTNELLDPELFILSKSEKKEEIPKKEIMEDEEDEAFIKFQSLFGYKKDVNKKSELYINRKKTIVYDYVLVNSHATGDTFGEMIYESPKSEEVNPRIATIISKENCHFATLKKELYHKILKQFNENNLQQQFLFLYSIDIFKDCNKNSFMKNMSFFIKRTIRANEILFSQEDSVGNDRSIYFVESGQLFSYSNISLNEIENLFNNLNYKGLILPDDAHEDNLFNKENHYFNQFKDKKIFINLFTFSQKDLIGYNDALYNDKYIYTVKCQSSFAVVYEIKLKFFNLIVNSEAKLYQILERYEGLKRNIMMKFFLNAFNNKINFYKFISFENLEHEKEAKKIVHKNYFGKNPFIEEKNFNDVNNDKQNFKLAKTINKVNDNIVELMPELKKIDNLTSINKLISINKLSKSYLNDNQTQLTNKNKSIMKMTMTMLSSNKSINNLIGSSRNLKKLVKLNPEQMNKTLKKKLSGLYSNSKEKLPKVKFDTFNNNSIDKKNSLPIIMNTLPNNNDNNITSYKEEKNNRNKSQNIFNKKSINKLNSNELNKNYEYSFGSSFLSESYLKAKTSKAKEKPKKIFKLFLDNKNNNLEFENKENNNKNDETKLKKYLNDLPDFYEKNKNSKKVFFGMNNKSLYKNNILFTDFK